MEQDHEEPEQEDEQGSSSDAAGAEVAPPPGTHTALPPKLEAWRKRSATGAILTGFALGLQEALEKPKEEPSIMMETSGDPPKDLPVEADFEYGRPKHSVVQIRPWLLPERSDESPPPSDDSPPPSDQSPPRSDQSPDATAENGGSDDPGRPE